VFRIHDVLGRAASDATTVQRESRADLSSGSTTSSTRGRRVRFVGNFVSIKPLIQLMNSLACA
jgi:hypothetical protein